MIFEQIPVGNMENFAYVIGDEKTKLATIVDPAFEVEKILKVVEKNKLKVKYIINTHSHFDHVSGNEEIVKKTGAKIIVHRLVKMKVDIFVDDNDVIKLGNLKIKVIHTPGHTPDSICLLVENKLLTGDTLFVGECGRTDFPGGDSRQMYDSLFNKLMKLDNNIGIYPGHDYGNTCSSTIGFERKNNYTLKLRTEEEFVQFMKEP